MAHGIAVSPLMGSALPDTRSAHRHNTQRAKGKQKLRLYFIYIWCFKFHGRVLFVRSKERRMRCEVRRCLHVSHWPAGTFIGAILSEFSAYGAEFIVFD